MGGSIKSESDVTSLLLNSLISMVKMCVKQLKLDSTTYLEAAKKIRVNPEACIGFEGSGAGITALSKAGLFSVAVHPAYRLRPELQNAALKVEILNAIHPKLKSWYLMRY